MSKLSQLINNEELLTKAVRAESKDEVKGILKEGGLEVNDAELEEIAGGMSKTAKVVLGVLGGVAGAAGTAIGASYLINKGKKKSQESHQQDMESIPTDWNRTSWE